MPSIQIIAAMARNRIIGQGNRLPWHLPEDMAYFRRVTNGHPVVMGRKTWDSLPPRFRPLPGRRNVVLSRQPGWSAPGAEVAHDLHSALGLLAQAPTVFVLGGAEVFAQALALADGLWITLIDRDIPGDVWFPPLPSQFRLCSSESHQAAAPNDFSFAFQRYERER